MTKFYFVCMPPPGLPRTVSSCNMVKFPDLSAGWNLRGPAGQTERVVAIPEHALNCFYEQSRSVATQGLHNSGGSSRQHVMEAFWHTHTRLHQMEFKIAVLR